MDRRPVAITGAGAIGVGFAVTFAVAGRPARLWDPFATSLATAVPALRDRLGLLHDHGLLDDPEAALSRVEILEDLERAVAGACLVQECIPEDVETKRTHFRTLAAAADPDAVLASSTSALLPDWIAKGLDAADRVLVAHPANPPYLLPVIELVPGTATEPATVAAADGIYRDAGLTPVHVRRQVQGFVLNRLQGAVLREAYCLVRDGVATVEEIDGLMRDGLGRRWSVVGPFETADLNVAGGIPAHAARMGEAYWRMGRERGQDDPWTEPLVAEVSRQRQSLLPADQRVERVLWRDHQLARLVSLAREGSLRRKRGGQP